MQFNATLLQCTCKSNSTPILLYMFPRFLRCQHGSTLGSFKKKHITGENEYYSMEFLNSNKPLVLKTITAYCISVYQNNALGDIMKSSSGKKYKSLSRFLENTIHVHYMLYTLYCTAECIAMHMTGLDLNSSDMFWHLQMHSCLFT